MARIQISKELKRPAIVVTRSAIKREKIVYIALANKEHSYTNGKSRIVYIGTTEKGINRIAGSAAQRGKELLGEHGINELSFYVVYAKRGRKRLESVWEKLERALIQAFKDRFYQAPTLNDQGRNADWRSYYKFFKKSQPAKIIEIFSTKK